MLLVRKYEPHKIEEILGNKEIISLFGDTDGDFPHLLLAGPPGTGKTSLAHILRVGHDTLELNASDERGVETVRSRIKEFCMKNTQNKLIILDECDSLTAAAQQALRRLMESTDTKFILIANQPADIIEPLQSRCAMLRFARIGADDFRERIRHICKNENIRLTEDGYEALEMLADGDMRACLSILQGLVGLDEVVDGEFLYTIGGVPSYKSILRMLDMLREGRLEESIGEFESLWTRKYEASDLISGLYRVARSWDNYEALKTIGKYQLRITGGVTSKLQFYGLFEELHGLFAGRAEQC